MDREAEAQEKIAADEARADTVIDSVCDVCGTAHQLMLSPGDDQLPPCPSCGATWSDRALIATLWAIMPMPGTLRLSQLVAAKAQHGLRCAAFGVPLSPSVKVPGLFDVVFRSDFIEMVRRRKANKMGLRMPLPDATLDLLVTSGVRPLALGLTEIARVLRPGGRLIVANGLRWPFPEATIGMPEVAPDKPAAATQVELTLGADIIDMARAAGLHAWIDRPAAGYGILRRHALLVAVRGG